MLGFMPFLTQGFGEGGRQLGIYEEAHKSRRSHDGVVHLGGSKFKTGLNILRLEIRKIAKDFLLGNPGCQHLEDVFDTNPHAPNAGASTKLLGVKSDPVKMLHLRRL